jgi:hypothetical protein
VKYSVREIDPKSWASLYSEISHFSSFGEIMPSGQERIDFALVVCESEKPKGFVTCKELDSETLYWQYGGAFSESKKTFSVAPCYQELIAWSLARYQRITTRIENINHAMLKMALKCGFQIVGLTNFKNKIYLELLTERGI